ncbi:MAG: DNA-methyltransferase [Nitrospiraceae bacterium]
MDMKPKLRPLYSTKCGKAFVGDAIEVMSRLAPSSVNLVVTSPPYALHFKKEYGTVSQRDYVSWLVPFGREIRRILADDGSFVLNIGGSWTPGAPTRSLCHFEALIALVQEVGFYLAQEFYWYNPAKLPAPAEWVNVRKLRVKDAVECLWWLSKTQWPKADNQRVLQQYSPDMLRLIKKGYRAKKRPSGHSITSKFKEREGSIPPNILILGNNDANGHYLSECKRIGYKPHPARFPIQLPAFFIRFLTDPNDLVLDPFAGSNTTGEAAEREGRHWIAIDSRQDYLEASESRFVDEAADQIVLFPSSEPADTLDTEDLKLPGY